MSASEREQRRRRFSSQSAAETEAVGARLTERLEPGDVVVVSGEIGAGKTTLIRGACRALGVEGPITSPTFTIGQRYEGGRLPISHLDLYRLENLEDEDPALLDDYLDPAGVAFIEWPAVADSHLARRALEVRIHHTGGDTRIVELTDPA
ncbi:MAG TPA: tRNA (adenosine(37)-N6)-threonylcarbamoyltransferase complex ATPase subunit type 1 TsaE [Solirubrobacterales bacterium]